MCIAVASLGPLNIQSDVQGWLYSKWAAPKKINNRLRKRGTTVMKERRGWWRNGRNQEEWKQKQEMVGSWCSQLSSRTPFLYIFSEISFCTIFLSEEDSLQFTEIGSKSSITSFDFVGIEFRAGFPFYIYFWFFVVHFLRFHIPFFF